MHALRSEPRDNDATVCCRSGVGIRGFDVALLEWLTLVSDSFPDNLSSLFIECIDHPAVQRSVFRCITVTIEPGTKRGFRITAHSARYKDSISPNDRTRMRQPWDRCTPENVLACVGVPLVRQVLSVSDA